MMLALKVCLSRVVTPCVAGILAVLAGCEALPKPTPVPTSVATFFPKPTVIPSSTVAPTRAPANTPTPSRTPTDTPSPTPTHTPTVTPTPTATISPYAARVNNDVTISKAALATEIRRVSIALKDSKPVTTSAPAIREQALGALIDSALLGNYAASNAISITSAMVDEEAQRIVRLRGGALGYATWLRDTLQTDADVRTLVERDLTGRAVRQAVLDGAPTSAQYLRLSHIVVGSAAEAAQIVAQLKSGANFAQLALALSLDATTRGNSGDLGWLFVDAIAPGALAWPEIETAALALGDGEISGVVRTPIGFHVVKLVGRNVRPLSADDSARLRGALFARWFANLKTSAQIERFP